MTSVRDATIAGFNELIRQQKSLPGETDVLLVQFDDQYDIVFDLPIAEVPPLDRETFIPRGSTALLDAQGRTITMLERQLASLPEARRHGKICFVTLTDGQENASRVYGVDQVAEMIRRHREEHGWEFIFLGANQDAIATATKLNISGGASMTFSPQPRAVASAIASASKLVALFREGEVAEFTQEDRDEALAEKKAV
jgi:hypothetical protein